MAKQGRPKKEMMLAVNATIEGKTKEVERLIEEHNLDETELAEALERRKGIRYPFTRKKRSKKAKKKAVTPVATPVDVLSMMDGRTKIVTLIEIEEKARELLSKKSEEEVARTRSSLRKVEKLEKDLEEARATLRS